MSIQQNCPVRYPATPQDRVAHSAAPNGTNGGYESFGITGQQSANACAIGANGYGRSTGFLKTWLQS